MKEIRNVLFDLDGTIIDPKEGIINSIIFALDKMGIQETNHSELISFIGPPLIHSFSNRYQLSDKDAKKIVDFYREYYSTKGIYQNTLYPDALKSIASLNKERYRLFIATSKPTIFAEKIISYLNLTNFFEGIIGSNLNNTRTDKTELISFALDKYILKKEHTVMVGDRMFDITGAKNNSIISIGVTFGYGSFYELQHAKPEFLVNNYPELLSLLIR